MMTCSHPAPPLHRVVVTVVVVVLLLLLLLQPVVATRTVAASFTPAKQRTACPPTQKSTLWSRRSAFARCSSCHAHPHGAPPGLRGVVQPVVVWAVHTRVPVEGSATTHRGTAAALRHRSP